MATTTRRRKKIKVQKETKVDKVSTNNSSYPTHLSSEDLRQLENLSKDVIIAKMDMNLEEQALRNISLELQLLQNKLTKQHQLVQAKSDFFEQKKAKYADYRVSINPKYGLKESDSLGYNPESGELVR